MKMKIKFKNNLNNKLTMLNLMEISSIIIKKNNNSNNINHKKELK